ncbi:SpoIID/LytB domain-containing protein [[Phormidium] sp. ETS-05]|uniref:SpoIID/LytB domain-containing protein n=1 Tax=[Phormidium] sp. ETS-05 TaxID=222819 RepID=UPI0031FEEAD1
MALDRWQTGQILIEPSNGGYAYIGDRWYRGRIHIVPVSGNLTAVNIVDLEQYLYSVIGAEMSPSWPQEALKAQAVAARSYALYQRDRYSNSIYDVGDTQAWQVYKGLESEANTTQAAVEATKGQVLTYNGKIIEAVFHSSSGGHTENVEDVSEPRPYLRGVPDYDAGTPVYEWSSSISRAQLSNLMGVGNISAIKPERTSKTGRVISVRAYGSDGERLLSGEQLQSLLNLRSTLFTINPNGNTFAIYGRGFGHGVGMSQWGAYNLANQGYNYQQILGHYYRNSALAKIKID